ncbi:hypothetical protein EHQ58_17355 [Leptospira ognonensis]|uniref:PilZ domain-containing protein n=1 Tax=Leptospira ognonensis TaxID=2484945 RepID=A0A4R9JWL5_9LEPT|nr:hypothetical protein [Leptospira ognonensis]TGL56390.1 hypothetical protein EHQ58_17355 [Leptospira ognonensis]
MEKEITDPRSIQKLIDSLYKLTPVFMEVDGEDIPVKIIENKINSVIVRSPRVNANTTERRLTMKSKENLFLATFTEVNVDEFGNSILKPSSIFIRDILAVKESNQFTVSNIISQTDIFKSLTDDRIGLIIKNAPKVNFMFDFFEVYVNERQNSRMRLLNAHNKPVFIPNYEKPELVKPDFIPLKEYLPIAKSNPNFEKYKSEICLPIKYKNFLMIGYVHAMHTTRLDLNSFNTFKLIVSSIVKEVHSSGIFEESREICTVEEVTPNSIRFLHAPTRLATRIFSMKAILIFDIVNKEGRKKFFRGTVSSIKPMNKEFLIGCDFMISSPEEGEAIADFLKK